MEGMNRLLILLLLMGLLYALYRHQQHILCGHIESKRTIDLNNRGKKKYRKKRNHRRVCKENNYKKSDKNLVKFNRIPQNNNSDESITNDSLNKISEGQVSQLSIGSLEDIVTIDHENDGYRLDSILDTMDGSTNGTYGTDGNLSFLDDNEINSNSESFFQ